MKGKTISLCVLLFCAVMLEVVSHDILLNSFHPKTSSWVYFFSGLLIGIIILLPVDRGGFVSQKDSHPNKYYYLIGVILLFAAFIPSVNQIFQAHSIDYKVADMLPIMQIMSDRFLEGGNPYEIIPEIWGGMQPIYLPAMWLPFIPAELFEFDMRWVTYFMIFLGCSSFVLPKFSQSIVSKWTLVSLVPLGILIYSITKVDVRLLVHSEEGVVICYYLLLAAALYYRSFTLIVVSLALCMMSRYSLAVWALMFVFYVYFYHTKSRSLSLILYSAGFSLFLLVISRGILHLDVFASLSGDYLRDIQDPDHKWKFMPTINESLGFAKFFRYQDLPNLHTIFLALSIFVPIGCLLVYHRCRTSINQRFFNLASLKISLVFFYNFLILPVQYLFYTSTFLSIAILYFYLKEELSAK